MIRRAKQKDLEKLLKLQNGIVITCLKNLVLQLNKDIN